MKGDIKSRKDGEASYRRKERALDHGALKKKKKLVNIGELLCNHFNIEDGRKNPTFSVYYGLLFQER